MTTKITIAPERAKKIGYPVSRGMMTYMVVQLMSRTAMSKVQAFEEVLDMLETEEDIAEQLNKLAWEAQQAEKSKSNDEPLAKDR